MHVKRDDNVVVITGKDKGKSGKILRAYPTRDLVLVEGINIKKKHVRATKQGGKGQIVDRPAPIHVSNVRLADKPKKEKKVAAPKAEKTEKKAAPAKKAKASK